MLITVQEVIDTIRSGKETYFLSFPDMYATLFEHMVETKELKPDDQFRYEERLLVFPSGSLVNWLHEPIEVSPAVAYASRFKEGFYVGPDNAPFETYCRKDAPEVLHIDFHYTIAGVDYLDRLTKKRYAKLAATLRQETNISLRETGPEGLPDIMQVFAQKAKRDNYEDSIELFPKLLATLPPQNVRYFVAESLESGQTIGGWVAIKTPHAEKDIWYFLIANTIERCLYTAHSLMAQRFFAAGSYMHYGPDFTFDPDLDKKYVYKRNLSTGSWKVPYIAIVPPPVKPPYYDLRTDEWVLDKPPSLTPLPQDTYTPHLGLTSQQITQEVNRAIAAFFENDGQTASANTLTLAKAIEEGQERMEMDTLDLLAIHVAASMVIGMAESPADIEFDFKSGPQVPEGTTLN